MRATAKPHSFLRGLDLIRWVKTSPRFSVLAAVFDFPSLRLSHLTYYTYLAVSEKSLVWVIHFFNHRHILNPSNKDTKYMASGKGYRKRRFK